MNRPNLMIKIPATKEGIPAVRECIAAGLNINVTLIFSLERYQAVMEAYLAGLEERVKKGQPIEHIASVASFFVSRVDTKIDPRLIELAKKPEAKSRAEGLLGKAAIANATRGLFAVQKTIRCTALPGIEGGRRACPAPVVGFHQHQEPGLPGCDLRRAVDRT